MSDERPNDLGLPDNIGEDTVRAFTATLAEARDASHRLSNRLQEATLALDAAERRLRARRLRYVAGAMVVVLAVLAVGVIRQYDHERLVTARQQMSCDDRNEIKGVMRDILLLANQPDPDESPAERERRMAFFAEALPLLARTDCNAVFSNEGA